MKEKYRQILEKSFSIPREESIQKSIGTFSPAEKMLFFLLVALFIGSFILILSNINKFFLVEVPAHGGSFTEGIIGSPRFINPLLENSDTDRDLTALVYSGLLKATPEGELIEDLAESYSVSEDGFTYDFTLRDDIFFHDRVRVTADDIVFTVQKAQDPSLKSSKRASWDGVTVEKISEREIRFILKQPYGPFLENATLGILPKHIWVKAGTGQFPFSKFNNEPVGSGPYKIKKIKYNSGGTPESYELESFSRYALGEPNISNVRIVFYSSENDLLEGYKKGEVDGINSISPDKLEGLEKLGARIERSPLPRIFAVFFNQNEAQIFTNKEVRLALDTVLNKKEIVQEVLGGYGTDIDGPIPPGVLGSAREKVRRQKTSNLEKRKNLAIEMLESGGWKLGEESGIWEKKTKKEESQLRFSLSTSNTPELKAAAEIIARQWNDIGVEVSLKVFEAGDLNQNVIRPRKYDALLFGEIISRELDLFAFWHSSQRNDPGLNIALYANITADKLLGDARTATDRNVMIDNYRKFEDEIDKDIPAVFVYSPDFIYIIPKKIKAFKLGAVATPGERFLNVHEWYIEADKVWNFFD
ncbi:MAG: peptide ABC transporter substrate-binding protein [Candidatus Pacebacteria bacterium]|jgi:peptide/nickel transport system substrate-binding protein|nr:peptide ABC transporter substrate-binding protein [Candidatus Paceibacterota bacterium]|tara:strand:+ start:9145 stop:10905 length:1761 start_codon:yes stop_codon:yes gene_type:complete